MRQREAEQQGMIAERERRSRLAQILPDVPKWDPNQQRMAESALGVTGLVEKPEITTGKTIGALSDPSIDNLSKLPPLEAIFAQHQAKGGSLAPTPENPSAGPTPDNSTIERLVAARQAKESGLQAQVPYTDVENFDPATGAKVSNFFQQNKLGDVGARTTELAPADKNRIDYNANLGPGGQFDPNRIKSEIGRTNTIETGTAGPKATTAGRISGAQTGARLGVEHSPQFTNARVNEAGRIAEQSAATQAKYRPPVEWQEKRKHSMALLSNLEAMARKLEDRGAGIPTGGEAMIEGGLWGKGARMLNTQETEDDIQYTSTAYDHAAQMTVLKSGLQQRKDELQLVVNTLFKRKVDSPQVVADKQIRRQIFALSQNAATPGHAGALIGASIMNHKVPLEMLPLLKNDDLEFASGVVEGSRGLIGFDESKAEYFLVKQ